MLKNPRLRWMALALWLTIAALYISVLWSRGESPLQVVIHALHWLKTETLAPLAYILAFVCRPVIFVPASVLAVVAGHCFGPFWGLFWALVAGTLAASVVYVLGRWWGAGPGDAEDQGRWRSFLKNLSKRGFQTTVTMRVAMLPYDPVSFLCGNVRVPLGSFLGGTFIGNLPGTTSCVLFGAGIKGDFHGQTPSIDWHMQGAAILLLAAAFLLQAWIKRRERARSGAEV